VINSKQILHQSRSILTVVYCHLMYLWYDVLKMTLYLLWFPFQRPITPCLIMRKTTDKTSVEWPSIKCLTSIPQNCQGLQKREDWKSHSQEKLNKIWWLYVILYLKWASEKYKGEKICIKYVLYFIIVDHYGAINCDKYTILIWNVDNSGNWVWYIQKLCTAFAVFL
jgi:hypothetical protein